MTQALHDDLRTFMYLDLIIQTVLSVRKQITSEHKNRAWPIRNLFSRADHTAVNIRRKPAGIITERRSQTSYILRSILNLFGRIGDCFLHHTFQY